MKTQSVLMCNGALAVELEKQFHKKLLTNMWHPARISEMQDVMMSSCVNMQTIDALNALSRSAKLAGTKHFIPSRATVQRYNRYIENSMRILVNCHLSRKGNRVIIVLRDLLSQIIINSPLLAKRGCSRQEIDSGLRPRSILVTATDS